MIQRVQTVYLMLSIVFLGIFLAVPSFFEVVEGEIVPFVASENMELLLLAGLPVVLALASIFLFKNRALQIKLGGAALLMTLAVIALVGYYFYTSMQTAQEVGIAFGLILPPISLILIYLAIRAIKKDEKLVRSADRFR